ncbi:response regulator transcription factor [Shewanella waksmanii]|uniref:response regulator transcription factor n=1 Tax=Shewanella waksmanii TaxID=213783 RepID=UPI00048A7CD6|nr:response regulator transcription factor [Shewanella waksmanii]
MSQILLVDDDQVFRDLLCQALEQQGHGVTCAADGIEALTCLKHFQPDVILLDIMMPKMDGFGLLNSCDKSTPVIVISAIDNEEERIKGYELGADDFVTKPFSIKELLVRMVALQRRVEIAQAQGVNQQVNSDINFNDLDYSVLIDSRKVTLTQTEYKLFKYLFERKGEVITKAELQRRVLQKELGKFDRNLDMHISNTRRKLAQIELPKTLINTVRGQGYSYAAL